MGRFSGRGFPTDFVQKEVRLRWGLEGDLLVSSLSDGVLLFRMQSVEEKDWVLENGPRSLSGQLLAALEGWRPNFKPGRDGVLSCQGSGSVTGFIP